MLSAICFNLDQSNILSSVNGLNQSNLCHTIPSFHDPETEAFRNIERKRENAG